MAFLCAPSTGVTATPVTTGFAPRIVAWNDWAPVATAPVAITEIRLSLTSFCPQVVPSSSFDLMKHWTSATGWPPTPPSWSLTYLTASCAPAVASPPITTWPPCWFTQPM